jgi:membrane associated rhomboid family serine protease
MFFIPYGTRELIRRIRFPYVTLLLVLANVAIFIYQVLLLINVGEAGLNSFLDSYAAVPSDITDGTPIEPGLLTSMFLHGGLLHIVGNMMYLLPFGDNVEDRLGHVRYLLFYLLCGLAATLIYTLFNAGSNIPLIGASGAIAGVLGGYLRLHPRGKVKGFLFIIIVLIPITLPAILFIGYWFVMQLFGSFASLGADAVSSGTSIAFVAHVGGFLAGLVLAPLMALPKSQATEPAELRSDR